MKFLIVVPFLLTILIHIGPNIRLMILFSSSLSLRFSFNIRDQY